MMMTTTPKKRLPRKKAKTIVIVTGCGNLKATIDEENGNITGVILRPDRKNGGCMTSSLEGHGRMISIALRHGVPIDLIIKNLEDIGCSTPVIDGAKSCSDAISIALKTYLKDRKDA